MLVSALVLMTTIFRFSKQYNSTRSHCCCYPCFLLILRVNTMKFNAVVRTELGKGASRRLRHAGQFPAIVYGGEAAPVSIALKHDDVINQMDKPEFYEGII